MVVSEFFHQPLLKHIFVPANPLCRFPPTMQRGSCRFQTNGKLPRLTERKEEIRRTAKRYIYIKWRSITILKTDVFSWKMRIPYQKQWWFGNTSLWKMVIGLPGYLYICVHIYIYTSSMEVQRPVLNVLCLHLFCFHARRNLQKTPPIQGNVFLFDGRNSFPSIGMWYNHIYIYIYTCIYINLSKYA